ncbi:MAG: ATP-dependent DNA helicase PcrA [Actinobacteria bacterium]|nr:ATP-dependent DNA helicase PcrA [Actinomycetota bacterium]
MTSLDLSGLNPDQYDAVVHRGGPLCVVAGAGSGKTRVLTHRIAHLIDSGVNPMQILAITFTNKAADEMRHRVIDLVGPGGKQMWVSTFHAACVRILRANAERLGFPRNFSIYDSDDSKRLITNVIRDFDLDPKRFPAKQVQSRISLWKNELITPHRASGLDLSNPAYEKIAEIYSEYQRRMQTAGAMDFDDLLTFTVKLFAEFPDVLESYRDRFQHILVDEYQDTNVAQNEIILMLAGVHGNVCIVGDQDQSVYAFRGADTRNLDDFSRAFGGRTTTIVLAQNYRSTQNILDAANAVISHNVGRQPKHLWTDKGGGDRILRYYASDEYDEARFVASQLKEQHEADARQWREMAVFYRANAQSRVIEEQLMHYGIPYKIIGGTKFYDRREVKDVIAYLRAVVNPLDEMSVKRVLNVPKRGIGDTSIRKLDAFAFARGTGFVESMRQAKDAGVSGPAVKGIAAFLAVIDSLVDCQDEPPAEVIRQILEATGYIKELEAEETIEAAGRIENLQELLGAAQEYARIDEFLEQVALVADTDDIDADNRVMLMTMHAAKGLEFPVVFIVGMEDGVFPHSRTLMEPTELEEERRLAYVGITRARERLCVTHAWTRSLFGQSQYNPPSRFLDEVPKELFDRQGNVDSSIDSDRASYRARTDWAMGRVPEYRRRDDEPDDNSWERNRERKVNAALRTPKPSNSQELGLRVGDDVRHATFGEGVIIDIKGAGDNAEATIRFVDAGTKHLMLTWAPLEKLN